MKQFLFFILFVLFFGNTGFGQIEFQLQAGISSSHLNFPGFKTYLESYNVQNSGSSMIKPAKFNPYGIGYQVGGMFRMKYFIAGINMGQITGFESKATFIYDQSRSFRFKNTYFDVQLGGRIGGKKFAFIPYVSMSINSLNLNTYFAYDKIKSYGGEKNLNGIYTSWRLVGLAGGRVEYRFTRMLGAFIDVSFILNKSEYLGGDFAESNSATDAKYFQSTATQDQVSAITGGLKEVYRISRGVFGLQLTIGSNEKE
jgi:hypothetical protein